MRAKSQHYQALKSGRGRGIRTPGPLLPKQVLYQAELCPGPWGRVCAPNASNRQANGAISVAVAARQAARARQTMAELKRNLASRIGTGLRA